MLNEEKNVYESRGNIIHASSLQECAHENMAHLQQLIVQFYSEKKKKEKKSIDF